MGDDIFEGLPPPSSNPPSKQEEEQSQQQAKVTFADPNTSKGESSPAPALKSALKRPKPAAASESASEAPAPGKRLRFKTTTDASETQVLEAMQKIASHIRNPSKFGKASKLAIQLIQAGSVKHGTRDPFFSILEAAMSSPTTCTDPSVRADYHTLFSAAQDTVEFLNEKQKNQFNIWTIKAVVANDLFTDDSFLFSKTAGRIKEAISNLPVATGDEDIEEAMTLQDQKETMGKNGQTTHMSVAAPRKHDNVECDPFGLDALIPSKGKKDERTKGKKEVTDRIRKEEDEEAKRFLKSQREALITCLEIAAKRYKIAWCQTVIDILAKYAVDNVSRFTSRQRDAIEKLWASIREQHIRRKQGKSVSGKLDVNAFEYLQQKYANEKISIRHAVGGGGDRRCEQWLG